jgi:hypothetical protein
MIIGQQTSPIQFKSTIPEEKFIWIEDACGNDFKRPECIRISTPYEPYIVKIDNHWEVRFKKP